MKNNYFFPLILTIEILLTGLTSFSQSINSLIPVRQKDAAYINAHQNRSNTTEVSVTSKSNASGLSATSAAPANIQKADAVSLPEDPNAYTLRGGIVNDNCNGATLLTVGTTCNPVIGTVTGASQSMPAISCAGFTGNANDDVWYRFVATNTSADIRVLGDASFDAVVEFLTGTCGAQTSVGCADETVNGGEEVISITGMTVGTTYYIRIYDYDADVPATPNFDICVVSAPAGSTHDNCATAITLNVGEGECNPTNGSVTNATASPNTSCGTGTPDDDVWYNFIATNDTVIVNVLGGTGFDAVVEAFYGNDCNNLTSMGCADGTLDGELESVEITGLIPGETIWLRVYDWFSGVPTGTDFTICVVNPCSVSIPNGATPEVETCGANVNGGCLMVTPAYQAISCNETVTGTLWADTAKRDLDWYQFTVTANTTATFTAAAELPFAIGIVNISNCAAPVILTNNASFLNGSACSSINVSTALTPGTYAAVITVYDFDYYVCSANLYNQYWASLSMSTTTPTVTTGGATTFCQGGNVTLTSSSATGNTWSPGGATTQQITASLSGSYTVSVNDPNGCGAQTSLPTTVTVQSLPSTPIITTGGATTFCQGGSVTLTSSAGDSYAWSPGGATTQSITATSSGTYTVVVTNANSCSSPASAGTAVTVNQNPTAFYTFAQNDPTIDFTGSVSGGTAPYSGFAWDFGDGQTGAGSPVSHTYTSPNTYVVELCVTDANGCEDCETQTVTILTIGIDDNTAISELNIFPNPASESLNIEFTTELVSSLEVKMINSLGQVVYQVTENNFSGTYKNTFSVNGFAAGAYTLQIITDNAVLNNRVVIK